MELFMPPLGNCNPALLICLKAVRRSSSYVAENLYVMPMNKLLEKIFNQKPAKRRLNFLKKSVRKNLSEKKKIGF